MQVDLNSLLHHPIFRPRDVVGRIQQPAETSSPEAQAPVPWPGVEIPVPDVVAWEDTEIDVRRIVL